MVLGCLRPSSQVGDPAPVLGRPAPVVGQPVPHVVVKSREDEDVKVIRLPGDITVTTKTTTTTTTKVTIEGPTKEVFEMAASLNADADCQNGRPSKDLDESIRFPTNASFTQQHLHNLRKQDEQAHRLEHAETVRRLIPSASIDEMTTTTTTTPT